MPHGVRTVGDKPVKLLWVNDAIEKWGVSRYEEGPGPYPAENGDTVALVRFNDLAPCRSAPHAKEVGFQRSCISWVGSASHATGTNFNPALAARNERVGISLIVLEPANRLPPDETARGNRLLVIARGRAILAKGHERIELGPQDALFCPAGAGLDLKALDGEPLNVVMMQTA